MKSQFRLFVTVLLVLIAEALGSIAQECARLVSGSMFDLVGLK